MGLFSRKNRLQTTMLVLDDTLVSAEWVINTYWNSLAASAWEGYQAAGRGAVFFKPNGDFWFGPAAAPAAIADRSEVSKRVREACASYHPEREIVFCASMARDEKAMSKGTTDVLVAIVSTPPQMVPPPQAR